MNSTAFICHSLPLRSLSNTSVSSRSFVMRKSRSKSRKGPKGPGRLSSSSEDKLKQLAGRYGISQSKPGDVLDRKFTESKSSSTYQKSFYESLVETFGASFLDSAERALYLILGVLLIAFLSGGIAISSEAFFKATGKEVSEGMSTTLEYIEKAFTPIGVVFLVFSSMLGLYKQAQLTSGATSFERIKDEEK